MKAAADTPSSLITIIAMSQGGCRRRYNIKDTDTYADADADTYADTDTVSSLAQVAQNVNIYALSITVPLWRCQRR